MCLNSFDYIFRNTCISDSYSWQKPLLHCKDIYHNKHCSTRRQEKNMDVQRKLFRERDASVGNEEPARQVNI